MTTRQQERVAHSTAPNEIDAIAQLRCLSGLFGSSNCEEDPLTLLLHTG